MGFKDKIAGSALNNDNIDLESLQKTVRGINYDISKVDPCSDKPFPFSFKDIAKELLGMFTILLPNVPNLPPSLIYLGNKAKGGMSALRMTANFLEEMKGLGVPIDTFVDGTENKFARATFLQYETLMKEKIEHEKITVAMKPGSVSIKGVGVGPGGPVDVTGFNTNFFTGAGGQG